MALFLIDENVPTSVSEVLRETDHDVTLVREILIEGTADPVIAAVAAEQQAIVVTWNVKDFRKEIRRYSFGLLGFRCEEPDGAEKLRKHLAHIEFEISQCERESRRFWVEIQKSGIKFHQPD